MKQIVCVPGLVQGGLWLPFAVEAAVLAIATVVLFLALHRVPPPAVVPQQQKQEPTSLLRMLFGAPWVVPCLLSVFSTCFMWGALTAVSAPEMEALFGYGALETGLLFAVSSFAYLVMCLVSGWLSDGHPTLRKILIIIGLVGAGMFTLLTGPSSFFSSLLDPTVMLMYIAVSGSAFLAAVCVQLKDVWRVWGRVLPLMSAFSCATVGFCATVF